MTSHEVGDIVLVRYPFTDLTSTKKRPAVILSPSEYADRFSDIVVMPLTSRAGEEPSLALIHWQTSGLRKPTWVKPIIGTLSAVLVEKRLGRLVAEDERCIRAALRMLLAGIWFR